MSESISNSGACADSLAIDESMPPTQLEPTSSSAFPKEHPSSSSGATIVVTKVSRFQLPLNALVGWDRQGQCTDTNIAWLPLHFPLPRDELVLNYEIHLLLLRHCRPRNEISVQPESIEERTVYKSMPDVLALVRALLSEYGTGNHGNLGTEDGESDKCTPRRKGRARPTLHQSDDTFHLLEDVESNLLSCLDSNINNASAHPVGKPKGTIAELSSALSDAMALVGTVDSVMRKLSKDPVICSSLHFQDFLCLHSAHHKSSSRTGSSTSRATPIVVSKEADAEQIVRRWISKTDHPSTRSKLELTLAITLRHELGGPILFLMAIYSATRLASMFCFMISGARIIFSIPFETYTTLLALSFFFGHNNGVSSRSRQGGFDLEKERSKGRHMPSPTNIGKPKGDNFSEETLSEPDDDHSTIAEEGGSESEEDVFIAEPIALSSPLPLFPSNNGITCWSKPNAKIFMVRSATYLENRIKLPSAPAVFECRGVDV